MGFILIFPKNFTEIPRCRKISFWTRLDQNGDRNEIENYGLTGIQIPRLAKSSGSSY